MRRSPLTYNNVGGKSFKGSTMTTFPSSPSSPNLNQVLSRAGHVSCINLCSLKARDGSSIQVICTIENSCAFFLLLLLLLRVVTSGLWLGLWGSSLNRVRWLRSYRKECAAVIYTTMAFGVAAVLGILQSLCRIMNNGRLLLCCVASILDYP